jgi:hypothetical protein
MWVASELGNGSTFSCTLPLYSLAKLLTPVIIHQQKMREALVLLKVEVKPRAKPVRGNWKENTQRCLEILQRCVYLDKDLVLPPMTTHGPEQAFFVVASTDMDRVSIMMTRIREQIDKVGDLKAACDLSLTAEPVKLSGAACTDPPERQVQAVAERVTEMVQRARPAQQDSTQGK